MKNKNDFPTRNSRNIIDRFQTENPTRKEKEEALKKMTVGEIDRLIEASNNIFGKIFYSQFKKGEKEK